MAKGFGISDLASLGFGQVGQLLDTMDMMSKTWSGMAMPAALDPTASIEELDKRIADLRAIEQWLALNQNMLRSTIQGLEVQRGTIATLQSFGRAMGVTEGRGEGGTLPWDPERLAALFAAAQGSAGQAASGTANTATANPAAGNAGASRVDPTDANASARTSAAAEGDAGDDAGRGTGHADATQLAQAWWNMLNEQFHQLASAATAGMAGAGDAGQAAPDARTAAPGVAASAAAEPARRTRRAPTSGTGSAKRSPRSP